MICSNGVAELRRSGMIVKVDTDRLFTVVTGMYPFGFISNGGMLMPAIKQHDGDNPVTWTLHIAGTHSEFLPFQVLDHECWIDTNKQVGKIKAARALREQMLILLDRNISTAVAGLEDIHPNLPYNLSK